jgi:hypothetical protein
MENETKIELGKSASKAFFTNPASYVMAFITLGSLIFTWGVSSANKKNSGDLNINELKQSVEKIRLIVTPQKAQIDTLTVMLQNHKDAQIVSDGVTNSKIDNVIDGQAKLKLFITNEFSKTMTPQQVNDMWNYFEKKNYNWIQSDTGRYKIQYFGNINQ